MGDSGVVVPALAAPSDEPVASFRSFVFMWSGQLLSTLGSALTSFALGVWVFERTGSATSFALVMLCASLPGLFVVPVAGSLADRVSRKALIIAPDVIDAAFKGVLLLVIAAGGLPVWALYVLAFVAATTGTVQAVALQAAIPTLVPPAQLSRANGLVQFEMAAQSLLAPALAGALYPALGLRGIIAVDVVTFAASIVAVLMTRIPRPTGAAQPPRPTRGGLAGIVAADLQLAWRYLAGMEGMLALIGLFAVVNVVATVFVTLLGPMVLSRHGVTAMGAIDAVYGAGMLGGAFLAGALPMPGNRPRVILLTLFVAAAGLVGAAFGTSWVATAVAVAVFVTPSPYANALFNALVQSKVSPDVMGRVASLMRLLMNSLTPLAILASGPLVEKVAAPLMQAGGPLDGTLLATLIGVGAGRGYSLLFIASGLVLVALIIVGLARRPIRELDRAIPDVTSA